MMFEKSSVQMTVFSYSGISIQRALFSSPASILFSGSRRLLVAESAIHSELALPISRS